MSLKRRIYGLPAMRLYRELRTAKLASMPAETPYGFRFAGNPSLQMPESLGDSAMLLVPGRIDAVSGAAEFDPFLTVAAGAAPPENPDPGPYTLRVHRAGGGTKTGLDKNQTLWDKPAPSLQFCDPSQPATSQRDHCRAGRSPIPM